MSIGTSAYKREIDDRDGWTHPVEIELDRAYAGKEIRMHVGPVPGGGTVYLDLAHARELREALDEAIMLAELAEGMDL